MIRDTSSVDRFRLRNTACLLAVFVAPASVSCETARGDANETREARPAPAASSVAVPLPAANEGSPAPDVKFILQDGFVLTLSSLRGKVVEVLFCPTGAAPTADCRSEADGIRDRWADLEAHGVSVVGVRAADVVSNRVLMAQERLPFDFAADLDGRIAGAFGVRAEELRAPRIFMIGRDGGIRKIWQGSDPTSHVRAILATD
jgi:peroxiredoxin Q/BCP